MFASLMFAALMLQTITELGEWCERSEVELTELSNEQDAHEGKLEEIINQASDEDKEEVRPH